MFIMNIGQSAAVSSHLSIVSGRNIALGIERGPGSTRMSRHFHSAGHGERPGQCRIASAAHAVVLSVWQDVHGLGILYLSVIAGAMN